MYKNKTGVNLVPSFYKINVFLAISVPAHCHCCYCRCNSQKLSALKLVASVYLKLLTYERSSPFMKVILWSYYSPSVCFFFLCISRISSSVDSSTSLIFPARIYTPQSATLKWGLQDLCNVLVLKFFRVRATLLCGSEKMTSLGALLSRVNAEFKTTWQMFDRFGYEPDHWERGKHSPRILVRVEGIGFCVYANSRSLSPV